MMWLLLGCIRAFSEITTEEAAEDSATTLQNSTDPEKPSTAPQNLVIVVVDTLRADHLPAYGSARNTMPLTGGEDWFVYDRFYAVGPWTAPTTPTILSGLEPYHHGV